MNMSNRPAWALVALALWAAAFGAADASADVAVSQAADRVVVAADRQRAVFDRDEQGRFILRIEVRQGDTWQSMFDGGMPLLRGPAFDAHPTDYDVLHDSPEHAAVSLSGTHPQHGYDWDVVVTARAGDPLLHFEITCDLQEPLHLTALEPHVGVWKNGIASGTHAVSQGPGNIYHGHDDISWGNSFPAAYMWDEGVESAVFFDMTPMTWMSHHNVFRFRGSRVQRFDLEGQTGLGLRIIDRNGTMIPAGDMVVSFYVYAAPAEAPVHRRQALDRMVDVFSSLHPATAEWPTDRAADKPASWGRVSDEIAKALMIKDVTWKDVDGFVWRDGPLFPEREVTSIRIGPDYAVESSCIEALNREAIEGWDFSTALNMIAPWVARQRVRGDADEAAHVQARVAGVKMFYSEKAEIVRWRPEVLSVGPMEMSWQNLTYPLQLFRVHEMQAPGDWEAAVGGRALMGMEGLIELAHVNDYVLPQWFDPITKQPLIQNDEPDLGIIYEPWQVGSYAWLMVRAYEMTGEARYVEEAKQAIRTLLTEMSFRVENERYEREYDDAVDFPVAEIFGNASGIIAAQWLATHTGDEQFEQFADDFLNSLLRMTYWYESSLYDDPRDQALQQVGLFRNHGGAYTGSAWENSEAVLPLTYYLKHRERHTDLLLSILNTHRVNAFYFFPPMFPDEAIPCPKLHQHEAHYLAIEDFYTREHGGRHGGMGLATYMSGSGMWYDLLFEAFAKADDHDIMVVSLDMIDSFEAAAAGARRQFLVFNGTDTERTFRIQHRALPEGDYHLRLGDDATEHTAAELREGTTLTLAPGEHRSVIVEHVEHDAMLQAINTNEAARDAMAHAYQLMQHAAEADGVTEQLAELKERFVEGEARFAAEDFQAALKHAQAIVQTLR
ncbi:MAG: hypothetical protein WD294_00020 [Phycisphaeraceae bacterium]